MKIIVNLILILWTQQTTCTVVGVTYLDDHNFDKSKKLKPGENSCNPFYWYPKPMPEHCFISTSTPKPAIVVPEPIPVLIAAHPFPIPFIPPMPVIPFAPHHIPPQFPPPPIPFSLQPIPSPQTQPKSLPFGVSMISSMPLPLIPGVSNPASPLNGPYGPPSVSSGAFNTDFGTHKLYPGIQLGMVPGLSGYVSPDGGINILPFSDAYADMFEHYKQKTITKKLKKKLRDINKYPWEL